ncbi:hypothetical protein [Thalassotalea sp. G2M2-11]|uniref:hypothetical protein n=1 Tax=Thalassotalea sp. G2M2-11 TaxID=2787627 RepID=UPI0019D24DB3|nr:hypothetical protein [Thalassotalea sp. G2M2-11]
MNTEQLTHFIQDYIAGFLHYNLEQVAACYALPCCLSTPDKMLVVQTNAEFTDEFNAIFNQLAEARTQKITVLKASVDNIDDHTILMCIDWAFSDDNDQVFADFSAFYHLNKQLNAYKIISVSSHDLSQSKLLAQPLSLNNTVFIKN